LRAQPWLVLGPPRGANHHRQPPFDVLWKVGEQGAGRGEVHCHVRRRPLRTGIVHASHHLDALLGGEPVHHLAHLPVADDEQLHTKSSAWSRSIASRRWASRITTVMLRRAAACEIIRSGNSSSSPTTRAPISGSARRRSPTAH